MDTIFADIVRLSRSFYIFVEFRVKLKDAIFALRIHYNFINMKKDIVSSN